MIHYPLISMNQNLQNGTRPRPTDNKCHCNVSKWSDMMTSSNGIIFRVTGPSCGKFTGEFPSQRPVTRSFDVFFDMHLNKWLSKQSWGWWFETPSCPLWRHCDENRGHGSTNNDCQCTKLENAWKIPTKSLWHYYDKPGDLECWLICLALCLSQMW